MLHKPQLAAANQNTESVKALSYKDTQIIEEATGINAALIPDAKATAVSEELSIPVQTAVESGKLPLLQSQVCTYFYGDMRHLSPLMLQIFLF